MDQFERRLETVKTVAIVLGLAIAVNELIIKNSSHSRNVASYTQKLIELDTSAPMVDALRDFSTEYYERIVKDGTLSEEDAWALDATTLPGFKVFIAWEACFSADLCNEALGLTYICTRARTYDKLREKLKPHVPYDREITNKLFFDLLNRCETSK